jgi:protein-tyrosine phosphatase
VPIITHPERQPWLARHPEALHAMAEMGALLQVTAMSVIGEFGEEPRSCTSYLLLKNLVHLIATDAHSLEFRPPLLRRAVRSAAGRLGEERARDLVTTMPAAVIDGRTITPPVARDREEKSGWFRRVLDRAAGGLR